MNCRRFCSKPAASSPIGATFFDHVKPNFRSYQEEIFGPVLQMVRADSFEDAVRLPSEHQ